MADTPLFWSRKGEVACAAHAPEPGTGRWQDEAWQELPPPRTLIRYQCQHCSSSPVRHVTRKPASVTPLILNVDDHEATLYARDRILRSNGFDVANAETGRDAFDANKRLRQPGATRHPPAGCRRP